MSLTTSYLLLTFGLIPYLTNGNPVPTEDVYCFRNHTPRGNFGPCDTALANPADPGGSNQFNNSQHCCAQAGAAGFTRNRSGSRCSSCTSLIEDESPGGGENEGAVVNGGWSHWDYWSDCSVTCGNGTRSTTRTCTNPAPQNGGRNCSGASTRAKNCDMGSCAVDGNWGDWGEYGECSATCGNNATQTRRRECDNPAPRDGGAPCDGDVEETGICDLPNCPIDGGWSTWSDWTDCSVTCGDGFEMQQRFCNNPPPQYGGQQCQGDDVQTRNCTVTNCPIHGGWSEWTDWHDCSATECNEFGLQLRSRACDNPEPSIDGRFCEGDVYDEQPCFGIEACPVNGEWGEWGVWSECSGTCDVSKRVRRRECDDPAPRNGGDTCIGMSTQSEDCESLEPCPTEVPEVTTIIVVCDDEDADCQNSEDGSGAGSETTEDPCSYFPNNSTSYELCKKGILDVTDIPGNEDGVTTTEQNPTTVDDGGGDPFDYSYSLSVYN